MKPRLMLVAGLAFVLAGFAPTAVCRAQTPAEEQAEIQKLIKADLDAGEIDKAIDKLEKLAKDKPKNMTAQFALMRIAQQRASQMSQTDRTGSIPAYMKSAEAARRLRAGAKNLNPEVSRLIAVCLYNGACSLALEKKTDEAMKMLVESVDAGFDEQTTFDTDNEIDSLRKRPEFKKLAEGVKKNKAELEAKLAKAKEESDAKKAKGEEETDAKAIEEAVAEVPKLFEKNKPFDFTFNLPTIEGKKVSLDDFKGKFLIVDFWGTWCPPCRKEIPHLVELHKQYKDKGLELVGINYEDGDPDEVKKVIKEFVAENKISYTCVIGDEKTQELVPDFEGYPTTLFLDRTGKVRLKIDGYVEKPVLEAIIKRLMDEKAK